MPDRDLPALCRRVAEAFEPVPARDPETDEYPEKWWRHAVLDEWGNETDALSPLGLWFYDYTSDEPKPRRFDIDANAAVALMLAAAERGIQMRVNSWPSRTFSAYCGEDLVGGLSPNHTSELGQAVLLAIARRLWPGEEL